MVEVSCTDIKFHLGKGELLGRYRFKRGERREGGREKKEKKKGKDRSLARFNIEYWIFIIRKKKGGKRSLPLDRYF